MEKWFLWMDAAHGAALNMALDDTLLADAAALGSPLLRFYTWEKPAVSIGYVQDYAAAPASGYEVVRRSTGGGVVFHDVDLTYSAVIPPGHWIEKLDRMESYHVFHRGIVRAMALLGLEAALAPSAAEAPDRATMRCFASPTRYDVLGSGGSKLAGAAQRRTKFGILHQGSVSLQPSGGDWDKLANALRDGLAAELPAQFEAFAPTDAFMAKAQQLASEKFSSDAWNKLR